MKYTKSGYVIDSNRIFKEESGKLIAEITFPLERDGVVNFDSTFVDESLRGQGIASQLVKLALETLAENDLKAIATCPYVVTWFERHPEEASSYLVK